MKMFSVNHISWSIKMNIKVMGNDMDIEKTLFFKWVNLESEGNDLIV